MITITHITDIKKHVMSESANNLRLRSYKLSLCFPIHALISHHNQILKSRMKSTSIFKKHIIFESQEGVSSYQWNRELNPLLADVFLEPERRQIKIHAFSGSEQTFSVSVQFISLFTVPFITLIIHNKNKFLLFQEM